MSLTYTDYCNYYAQNCKVCSGEKRVLTNSVWTSCGCQSVASAKYKFDQIQVYPESLKFKTWNDFNGVGENSRLTTPSFMDAKQKALEYCFGSSDIKVLQNKRTYNQIQTRLSQGRNLIVAGPRQSGRSLIGILILKEIIYSCAIRNQNIDFYWLKPFDLIEACRWTAYRDGSSKNIDYELLDYLAEVDFLFIDGIDLMPEYGDHRSPPDMTSINRLFGRRLIDRRPTIILCNERFLLYSNPAIGNSIRTQWGEEFLSLLMHPQNEIIKLEKEQRG